MQCKTKTIAMTRLTEQYQMFLTTFEEHKKRIMDIVAVELQVISTKPLSLGNGTYWVTEYNGEEVPAYWDEDSKKYYPIYNDGKSDEEFGWKDFSECCRLFDAIRDKLFSF